MAENTTGATSGTSSNSLTKMAPCAANPSTTVLLYNFVPDIDRFAKFFEGKLDNSYRAIDARTKPRGAANVSCFTIFFIVSVVACLVLRSIAVLQKNRYHRAMKHLSFGLLGCLIFLGSCSSNDDVVFCPPLSAPPEGARAFVVTDEHRQIVDVWAKRCARAMYSRGQW